ncbi:hypothetical protein GOODEAATRI_000787 [Goodea atripinnis]|uniref:Piccolo presynaptic cytomatrix protein n=1 Tax=Goodea atripinnis TaxID=208336 RepID=A0ABV0NGG1_9TELE
MVPQDPALRKALFPIPDLKITHVEVPPVADSTLSPLPALSKSAGSSVSTLVTNTIAIVAPVSVTVSSPSHPARPPPPIPPKPMSIPAGLVFTHKPGENIKPPPPPVAPKAATLPRMKEPPKALPLSLARPLESKLGVTSPKSPVSPRHAKCLQTYVVITLPSEPGSPTETITVQAPVRRGSIPSSTALGIQTTLPEQKTPTEAFSAHVTVRRASVPTVKHPPPIPKASTVVAEQVKTSEVVTAKVRAEEKSVPSAVRPLRSVADVITVSSDQESCIMAYAIAPSIKKAHVTQQESITQPHAPFEPTSELIPKPTEPKAYLILTDQSIVSEQSASSVSQQPCAVTEVGTVFPVKEREEPILQSTKPIATVQPGCLGEAIVVSQEPGLVEVVVHGRRPTVHSIVDDQQALSQIDVQGIGHTEKDIGNHATGAVLIGSTMPDKHHEIAAQEPDTAIEVVVHSKEEHIPGGLKDAYSFSELILMQQTDQPLENMAMVTEQLFTLQPNLAAEDITLPAKFEYPTEVVTTDPGARLSEIAVVSPVLHPPTVAVLVTLASEVSEVMPLPTVAETVTITSDHPAETHLVKGIQQVSTHPDICYTVQQYGTIATMSPPVTSLEKIPLQPGHETLTRFISKDFDDRIGFMPSSEIQHHRLAEFPVITAEETTFRRRSSVSSTVQAPYTSNDLFTIPAEFEMPAQVLTAESFPAARQESITMQQPQQFAQIINMPAEKDVSVGGYEAKVPYRREAIPLTEQQPETSTHLSEYDHPLEAITPEAHTKRSSTLSAQDIQQSVSVAPVTITKIQQESIESQEIRGPEKVVSSMSHMFSSSISTSGRPPENLSSRVTQVVTTEVQRTTVSVVHERLQQVPPQSIAITIQPDIAKVQPLPKQNGRIIYPGDVIDLRMIKSGIKMTEQGMDLTPPESCRQSVSSDSTGRHITAVQPEIVNLSAEFTPTTTLSVVSDSITIVTCTATIASYNNIPAEKPLDLQGPVASLPLPLTTPTHKPFEPLTQIVYKPVKAQPVFTDVVSMVQDIPINLSFEALVSSGGKKPLTSAPTLISNVGPVVSLEATRAMDLSNYKPVRAMVALSDTGPGVVTSVVEDDGVPVDLTAGRRSICCDVIYKLPFTGRKIVPFEAELSKEFFPTALADLITGYPEMYSDTTLEAIAASLDALASSPIFPGLDNSKMAQYQMEREFLELEKLKQLCLSEELEWERQEIQRYREQEQLMVQRELEELQALKQQLLLQQEEEHHAHMVAQQETYAQQKEQLQQIQQLQLQLQQQLDEHYSSTGMTGNLLEAKYAGVGDSGQYWPVKDEPVLPSTGAQTEQHHEQLNIVKLQADQDLGKKILDSGVQTDDEDSAEKQHMGKKKKTKRNLDSLVQSDDEDQDEWDAPAKVRRRTRKHSGDGKHGSKVSSIAIQTVAEISVQTDHSGTIKRPNVQMDTKIEIIKHISAPENSQRGSSLSCQTDTDRGHSPVEVGYSMQLTADVPSKAKVLYSQVSPLSPEKSYGGQRMLTADPNRFSSGPRSLKVGQKSLSDPKSLSPSTDNRIGGYYADSYSRTLPDPPNEDDSLAGRSGYSTNSARRRLARSTTMARAKILRDIDKELDLVERESSKLRKKQAELDEEEKEIDAKLR